MATANGQKFNWISTGEMHGKVFSVIFHFSQLQLPRVVVAIWLNNSSAHKLCPTAGIPLDAASRRCKRKISHTHANRWYVAQVSERCISSMQMLKKLQKPQAVGGERGAKWRLSVYSLTSVPNAWLRGCVIHIPCKHLIGVTGMHELC